MITSARMLWTCHWSSRRIQRYLDAERGVPLSADEARRLEQHLAICEHCAALADEHRLLRQVLDNLSQRTAPAPDAVGRLHERLDRIIAEQSP